MSLNRVVALATPLFAAAAGWVATQAAELVPGINISEEELTEIFIAGALVALAPAAQWLHGWQKWEARKADAQQAAELAAVTAPPTLVEVDANGDGYYDEYGEYDELEDLADLEDLDELDEGLLEDEELAPRGG